MPPSSPAMRWSVLVGIDPDVVQVAVRAAADVGEALAAVVADDQREVGLEDAVLVLRIDDQVARSRTGRQTMFWLLVALPPRSRRRRRNDRAPSVGVRLRRRHRRRSAFDGAIVDRDAAPRLRREALARSLASSSVQVAPPSVDLKRPLPLGASGPSPPERNVQPLRRKSHMPAKISFGFFGSIDDHRAAGREVARPSGLRPGLAAVGRLVEAALVASRSRACPGTHAKTVSLFVGSTRIFDDALRLSAGPCSSRSRRRRSTCRCRRRSRRCCASTASPVPTQTFFGFFGSIVTAPIDCTGCLSKTGLKVVPPSSDFQTPPLAAPT